ncbi:MAG: hypothetical protein ISP01_08635 [Methanobrevibacter arboriphilus]|uniref:Uncharacterized protein n=1 Tax=Methanobrevibacter arboriphilus TaxID=39441 RepID=A0A843AHS4_METAZ|nr:hypothetical protein [Methanobrevibacter arboriphilus]MBF4469453.1 hypothetical protein [Methanobrevibacter arboriphilus]
MKFKEFLEITSKDNIVETIFDLNKNLYKLKKEQMENRLKLEKMELNIRDKRFELIKNIDWKKLEITNEPGRNAHIKPILEKDQIAIDELRYTIKKLDLTISNLRRELNLCDHIISKYDSIILDKVEVGEPDFEIPNEFTTGDKITKNTGLGDPKASQWIAQAKQYLLDNKENVTIEKIKELALNDLNDPESVINKDSFNKIIKQLQIEGI